MRCFGPAVGAFLAADCDRGRVCGAGDGLLVGFEYDAAALRVDCILGLARGFGFFGFDRDAVSRWATVSFDFWDDTLAAVVD